MDDVAIDWSTAEVTVSSGDTLELAVVLTPEADSTWTNELSRLSGKQRPPLSGESWWANTPSFGKLIVGGVEPGNEDRMRAALDEMVAEANRAAARTRSEGADKKRREDEEHRARKEDAEQMTERFRAGE